VLQDRLLQPLQGLARLDSELVHQVVPSSLVRVERVGLTVGAVEGEHLLGAKPLPKRVLADEHLQLAEHLLVTTLGEIAVDPIHEQGQSQLVEPLHLVLAHIRHSHAPDREHAVIRHHQRILEGLSAREPELATEAIETYARALSRWLGGMRGR
jgi:hypothetical protein